MQLSNLEISIQSTNVTHLVKLEECVCNIARIKFLYCSARL